MRFSMNLSDDKVIKFLDDCYDAGIKRPELFLMSKMPQVYNWLKGAFPRGILPTDIDGEVEVNGNFLRFEFKHENAALNGYLPKGQACALQRLVQHAPFTVLLIATNDEGDVTYHNRWHRTEKTGWVPSSKQIIKELCSKWAEWAAKTPGAQH